MDLTLLALVSAALALLPALVYVRNRRLYDAPPLPDTASDANTPGVSVLIPARDEAAGIATAVTAALASQGVCLEVLVLDDHSEDATAAIVAALAVHESRLRLLQGPPLPPGWCGKPHACAVLARYARFPILVFVDADVRLESTGLARLAGFLKTSGADLVSGIPRQETVTWLECLVIPLLHTMLLGFLPLWRMRRSRHPAYGSGCGQLFMVRREAYEGAGGHAAIRASWHDGLTLPRAFRRAGWRTDLCDATELATCRMYGSASALWQGLAKNAREGLAAPSMLLPSTLLLLGGQCLPPLLLLLGGLLAVPPLALGLALLGTLAAYGPRLAMRRRFRQPLGGALLHPVGVLLLVLIQWYAWSRACLGRPATWKGRGYTDRGPSL
ncbi:MAG: glycosyltransferase family 2 protein [Candidatus Tectimicrobiota bacterium]